MNFRILLLEIVISTRFTSLKMALEITDEREEEDIVKIHNNATALLYTCKKIVQKSVGQQIN